MNALSPHPDDRPVVVLGVLPEVPADGDTGGCGVVSGVRQPELPAGVRSGCPGRE